MADEQQQLDLVATLMGAISNALASVHTSTIARITTVNATTIDCQPVTARLVNGVSIPLPVFADVPPLFMQGGGSYTAHPLAVGDYCLLIFTERCFDRWYNGEDNKPPLELRMHDYSDGIALCGINPLASAIAIPTVIQQTGDANADGNHTHQGTMARVGDTDITGNMLVTGDLTVDGSISCTGTISAAAFTGPAGGPMSTTVDIVTTGEVTAGGKNLSTHTHGGVTTGAGTTGGPS